MSRRFVAHGRPRHFRRLDIATRLDLHGGQNGTLGFDSFAADRPVDLIYGSGPFLPQKKLGAFLDFVAPLLKRRLSARA